LQADQSLWSFMRDPMWQFIGAASGVAALAVAIIATYLQRRRKALSYEILTKSSLVTMEDELAGKLEILYEGRQVDKVHLVTVRILNSANLPIAPADYIDPVRLSFGKGSQVLTASVSDRHPPELHGSVAAAGDSVLLPKLLLNPGDFLTLKMLVANMDSSPSVEARIVGVSSVGKFRENTSLLLSLGGAILTIVGLVLLIRIDRPHPSPSPKDVRELLPLSIFLVGYILILWSLFRRRNSPLRRIFEEIVFSMRKKKSRFR